MTWVTTFALALAQMVFIVAVAPLVNGFIQKLKARLQSRSGASVWQPYRDLTKLFRKRAVQSDSTSSLFVAVPVLVLGATLTAAALVPALWALANDGQGPALPLGDGILLIGLLALARFLTAVGALDAGGAFGGMGASREMTIAPLVEPVLMLIVFSVMVIAGTSDVTEIALRRSSLVALGVGAPDIIALAAVLVILIAETGRIPVDNPDTHLELTMLHEAMLLEHSGPALGCLMLATHVKQLVVMCLVCALFFPMGIAGELAPTALVVGFGAFAAKVLVLSLFLGLVESSYAKLRLFRLPQFLATGFVCAFVALALRLL